ncbi:hypothetical protein [Thalassobius vesicularis]|uniref:hypothetical protein n=1 Tax=Thalassobius vesicularis TaxID=1294297 RepID=UPI001454CC98|nr:hypothetical protein [Thalassobius vesicularis]
MARLFWISFLLAGALYATMGLWSSPYLLEEADGLPMFDLRPLGYTYDEARAYLDALSDEGRVFYLTVQQRLDMAFPGLLALSFVAAFQWLLRGSMRWGLSAVAVLSAGADYLENMRVHGLLIADTVTEQMVADASLATLIKSVSVTVCFTALLVLFARAVWNRR